MSKIGKKSIPLPAGVTVSVGDTEITVKGPKGTLTRRYSRDFAVSTEGNSISVKPVGPIRKDTSKHWGSLRSHLANMILGVSSGFERKLEFEGIGYRAEVSGKELMLSVGFTQPVRLTVPEGLNVSVAKNTITVSGIDKEKVGQFAAAIRKVRPPEPYKGTGIKYSDEVIRRKAGKKLAGAAGAAGAPGTA